jgi:hypothetical protein
MILYHEIAILLDGQFVFTNIHKYEYKRVRVQIYRHISVYVRIHIDKSIHTMTVLVQLNWPSVFF